MIVRIYFQNIIMRPDITLLSHVYDAFITSEYFCYGAILIFFGNIGLLTNHNHETVLRNVVSYFIFYRKKGTKIFFSLYGIYLWLAYHLGFKKIKYVIERCFFYCSRTANIRALHLQTKLCFQLSTTGHYDLVESGEIYKIY